MKRLFFRLVSAALLVFVALTTTFSISPALAQADTSRCKPGISAQAILDCLASVNANVDKKWTCLDLKRSHENALRRAGHSVNQENIGPCSALSKAVEMMTGSASGWRDCVIMINATNVTFSREATQCLSSYLTAQGRSHSSLGDCSVVAKTLNEAIQAAGRRTGMTPVTIDCNVGAEIVANLSGGASASFSACMGYSRENLEKHFIQCMGTSLSRDMTCMSARSSYERKLASANGGALPASYQTLSCNDIDPVLANAVAQMPVLSPLPSISSPPVLNSRAPSGSNSNSNWLIGGFAGFMIVWVIVGIVVYFLPTFIAFGRKHPSRIVILLINLFLGWSVLGWLVALIWSFFDKVPAVTVAQETSVTDELATLYDLKEKNVLTEAEYSARKARLLER